MADAFKGFSAEEIGLLLETYYSVNLVKYLTEEQKQLFDMEFILNYGVRVDPIVGGVSLIIPIVHGEAEVDLSAVKKAISDTLDLYHLDFSLIEPYFNEAVTIRTPGVASHLAIEDMPAERWALRIDLPDKITLVSNKHFCIECGGPLVGKNKKYCSDCDLEAEDFEELTDSEDFKELSLEQLREKRRQLLSALEQLSQMSEYADESVSEIKCREDLEVVEKEIANKVSGGRSLQLTEASRIIHELYSHVQESLRPKSGKARIFRLVGEPTALEAGAPMIGVREFSKEFQLINFAERPVELIRRLNAAGYSETDENIVHIYDREVKMKNVICEKCRKPVALSDRFCGHCGSKFLNDGLVMPSNQKGMMNVAFLEHLVKDPQGNINSTIVDRSRPDGFRHRFEIPSCHSIEELYAVQRDYEGYTVEDDYAIDGDISFSAIVQVAIDLSECAQEAGIRAYLPLYIGVMNQWSVSFEGEDWPKGEWGGKELPLYFTNDKKFARSIRERVLREGYPLDRLNKFADLLEARGFDMANFRASLRSPNKKAPKEVVKALMPYADVETDPRMDSFQHLIRSCCNKNKKCFGRTLLY